ncbi:16S rRNA (guanine(1516)-N(2))-methyltransferase [hydrothermal vent metagenome]|uniref:16S rRNA (Guanine(1516)-N(2))-methyltransferase n=1 Tax=hydrothermal vent metagenome TaxID=652676 RepID=A0A3B1DA07_9ZZZZ
MPIPLIPSEKYSDYIQKFANHWNFEVRQPTASDTFILKMSNGHLQLFKQDEPKLGAIYVDFTEGTNAHRRKFGGGRAQAIAKSIGFKKDHFPNIVDATAGLGKEAFILAALGCRVHMIERSPVIAALLENGLNRAKSDPNIGTWINQRLSLMHQDSLEGLLKLPFQPNVIYLDPMFPEKRKSALVKKDMRIFKTLLGPDADSDKLLNIALQTAKNRVVVKRPEYADYLADQKPNTSIKTKKNRFDIYLVN